MSVLNSAIKYFEYPITALIIVGIIPITGRIIAEIIKRINNLLAKIIGYSTVNFIGMYATFPGVIHHELSHALLAILTGAKIIKISLYYPEGNRLGYVKYVTRGPWILKSIQNTMTSIAPIMCGCLSLYGMYSYVNRNVDSLSIWHRVISGYIMISIFMHMTMSEEDCRTMKKGIFPVYLLILVVVYLLRFSLLRIICL